MPKLIIHNANSLKEVEDRRLDENLKLSPLERFEKALLLIELSLLFKKGPIKLPQGKGIVLKLKNA